MSTTSFIIERTRSSIRKRDSSQAKSERNMVLLGNKAMLSASGDRIEEGVKRVAWVAWK